MTSRLIDADLPMQHLEDQLSIALSKRSFRNPLMIGIRTGGVWVATQLHQRLGLTETLGILDISFYRDDFSQIGVHPNVKPSVLNTYVDERDIILVDDVFHTGRSSRAALNELFDYGRPRQVLLAVLVERQGKQLPLHPDCVGLQLSLQEHERITLHNDPFAIHINTLLLS